jgi:tetratricopeptide (TPR) repeat protein
VRSNKLYHILLSKDTKMQAAYNYNKLHFTFRIIVIILTLTICQTTFAQLATTYDEAIIYADKKLAESKLMDAKAYYQQALKLKPGDEYAKNKISSLVEKMKSAMATEDEYYDIIDFADELYDNNKLQEAIIEYNKALKIIPNDEYALTKVREITDFQTSERDKIEQFDREMETGSVYLGNGEFEKAISSFTEAAGIFPDKESPLTELNKANALKKEYEQKETLYNEKIEEAERYFLIKNYAESLKLYTEAKKILPEDEIAKNIIAQLVPLADKQIKFNRKIEEADEYYISKDFISARKYYLAAAEIWPEKNYPQDMIDKINEKLEGEKEDLENNYNQYIVKGDSLFDINEYALSLGSFNLALNLKPDERYPKSKVSEIEAIYKNQRFAAENDYRSTIASADSAFDAGSYNIALRQYETALEVKPDDEYPASKIMEIENILESVAAEEKANQQYNTIIQQADKLYSAGNYDLAITKYREAQALKSIENYPQSKIDAITNILANAAKQKQIDDKYNELVLIAVQQFNQAKLSEARLSYSNASELKPTEELPKVQIMAIDSIMMDITEQAEIKASYDILVKHGDSLKDIKEYDLSIIKYDEAILLIPNDNVAQSRKKTVETIQINIIKEAERKKAYDEAIAKGDNLFSEGSFELARVEFQKAQTLKNDQEYPRQRLKDITRELERLEAEKEERYAQSISDGDLNFDQGNYETALKKYQVAISINPIEDHPKQRINECNGFIAEKMKRLSVEYDIAIAEARKFYDAKIYDKAIVAFRKAMNIKSDETYPGEMIDQITKYIEENSIVDVINNQDTILMGSTDKFEFEPVKINVRKSNYIFIKAKNLSDKSTKLIFSYGSNTSKNGGFVVQVIEGNVYNDYIVRVGNQYKWFSEDNNWLTIHSENGDVEISMLRISKGY